MIMAKIIMVKMMMKIRKPEEECCQGDSSDQSKPSGRVDHEGAALTTIPGFVDLCLYLRYVSTVIVVFCHPLLEDPKRLMSTCCLPITRSWEENVSDVTSVSLPGNLFLKAFINMPAIYFGKNFQN